MGLITEFRITRIMLILEKLINFQNHSDSYHQIIRFLKFSLITL
jgi:hypothetical protein